ncbi:serine/threonine-protein kinase [Mariniblastus fucicola]|nr:serine/threonine-protein kinase [Mariniblastus fucicola]
MDPESAPAPTAVPATPSREKTKPNVRPAKSNSATDAATNPSATRQGQPKDEQTVAAAGAVAGPGKPTRAGRLGPYRLIKLLGEGGMGSVYLANQTTLDRNVALKVVRSKLARNPKMLARFTREAYAAAQLVHPNVVQIYDMGNDNGNSYFSMELVDGSSLHDLMSEKKNLDPDQATSYILHAARGLQCAHNAGMVHRDIKPANLLVNQDGLVKVADLGLVKVPEREEIDADVNELIAASASQDITRIGSTIGTPYYMAPEQAKSSAVDHRADIYSLGCTFYVLLTGKRPFEGKSLEEVVSKHNSEPLVLPSKVVERVPGELSAIVSQMMAKKPEDRYQSIGELIEDLEAFLGIKSSTAFTPDEADAEAIESACKSFNAPSTAKLRGVLPLALFAGSILLAFLTFFVSWKLATGFLLMPLFAVAAYFVASGLNHESVLFEKSRELFYRSGIFAWIKWTFAALLLVVASFLVGTFPHWLLLGVLGAALGAGFHFLIDVPLRKARREPIAKAEKLVRKMRIKGVEEATVQTFVAKYSANHWEEFFEALFGYAAKRRVRDELSKSETGKKKPKFRAWRDNVYDNLENRLESFANADERKHLQKVEQAGLVADGVSASDAKAQATQMADAIVDHGDSIRVAQLEKRLKEVDPEFARAQQRKKIKAMLAEARSGKYKKEQTTLERIGPVLDRFFGSYARFLIGSCLVVASLMWANNNDLLVSVDQLKELGQQGASVIQETVVTGETGDASVQAAESAKVAGQEMLASASKTTTPFLGLIDSFNPLIAGLILLFSTIVFGWRMSIFVIPAAIIAIFGGAFGIPDLIPFEVPHLNKLTAVIAIGLFLVGIVFGRREA